MGLGVTLGSSSVVVSENYQVLKCLFKLVYFSFSACGWLAKCLVPAVAQFSLSPACAVTFIGLRGCCD